MTESPRVDDRDLDRLLTDLRSRLPGFLPGWQPVAGSAGSALLHVTALQARALIERLNQAPDKNLLAFLDLLGVDVLTARGARAPVVFAARPHMPDSRVSAGTQVAAKPPGADAPLVLRPRSRSLWPRLASSTSSRYGPVGTATPTTAHRRGPVSRSPSSRPVFRFPTSSISRTRPSWRSPVPPPSS